MGSIPGLPQWVRDLVLLWLWYRPGSCHSDSTPSLVGTFKCCWCGHKIKKLLNDNQKSSSLSEARSPCVTLRRMDAEWIRGVLREPVA